MPYYCPKCLNPNRFFQRFSVCFGYEIDGDGKVTDGRVQQPRLSKRLICPDCNCDEMEITDDLKWLQELGKETRHEHKKK